MDAADQSAQLADQIRAAAASRTRLAICGSGSKHFLAGRPEGEPVDVTKHRGIVSYEPTELVLTARAGTALTEIEAALSEHHQMLAFEPPHFGPRATLGGTIACNLSGPRRPFAGAARDFVLGTKMINGQGDILNFGGQVMKNVAGYDVSRLMAGSHGTLGVLLEVSLKVLPRPPEETTLAFEMPAGKAIERMNTWSGQPLPLSAAAHTGETLYIRLSGSAAGVRSARARLGGERQDKGENFWHELREQQRSFFTTSTPLWRLSLPPATPPLDLPGKWLLDWAGAQRWLLSDAAAAGIQAAARSRGGYAAPYRNCAAAPSTLPAALAALNNAVRKALDPAGIMNTGLVHADGS